MSLTRSLESGRGRGVLSLVVLLTVVAAAVVAVVRAEGYRAPQLQLHDGAIWVTQRSTSSIGRLNTELEMIDTRVGATGKNQDVFQSGSLVLIREEDPNLLRVLDVRTGTVGKGIDLPPDARVAVGGDTAAVLDPSAGRLWIWSRSALSAGTFASSAPADVDGASALAVGLDGVVHVLTTGSGTSQVVRFQPDGSELDHKSLDRELKPSSITAVGALSVVLDPVSGNLAVPSGEVLPAKSLGTNLTLQQPGPADSTVLVASDGQLALVDLGGGRPTVTWSEGGGNPIAPVRLGTCVWGAWQDEPAKVRACTGKPAEGGPINDPKIRPGDPLQFRVNNNRVVLNQLVTGTVLVLDEAETTRVDDWSQALEVEQEDDGSRDPSAKLAVLSGQTKDEAGNDDTDVPEATENVPPDALDDTAVTRERRPIVINVLENDRDLNRDVLVVDSVDPVSPDAGTVAVVGVGSAVQFTPATGQSEPVSFSYTISDGRGGTDSARVTVTIKAGGTNEPPEAKDDTAVVEAGRTVSHNVLGNDHDPDGDALTLVRASAAEGAVQFRPDGAVVFSAPATPQSVTVTYDVVDEFNAAGSAVLRVDVRAPSNLDPVAVNDQLSALAGVEATVNILANDFDPNGDALTVTTVESRTDVSLQWSAQGEVRIRAEQPGSYAMAYSVTDGPSVASAVLRFDATEAGAQRPPVAVRDDVVLRVGVASVVPVLVNDVDPDGDVLVIERVTPGLASDGLTVETIEHRYLRLIATAPSSESFSFTYTVSDGSAQAEGTVVVRTVAGGVNQPPIANRDELSLRAGNITAIRVLANDVDPDGDELSLDGVSPIPDTDGLLFQQGNQLRYQAPSVERGAVLARYTVADSAGNKADGELVIHVTPADSTRNLPPNAPTLEARVIAGTEVTIRVPLVGIDPEGDPVTFLGFGDPPKLGTITSTTPSSMLYRANRDAAGTDRFTYRLRDDLGAEASGSVTVGIIQPPSVNSPPVALADRAEVRDGDSIPIDVLANDSDPDGDSLELVPAELGKPPRGSVRIDGDVVIYDAPSGEGEFETSFDYTVADARGATARGVATVAVVKAPPPQSPIARDDLVAPQIAGAAVVINVLDNDEDPDGDPARLRVAVDGEDGVSASDDQILLTMPNRAMRFAYSVTDSQGLSARAFVQVPLAADQAPLVGADRVETDFNRAVRVPVLENDTDPEGEGLHLERVVGSPRDGTAQVEGDEILFTPVTDFSGEASFAYEVSDGTNSAQGSVLVVVRAPNNRPPRFTTLPIDVPAGGERDIDLSKAVVDPDDGDTHTFADPRSGHGGVTTSLSGAVLTVTAAPTAKGVSTQVTVQASDGKPEGMVQGVVEVKVLANEKPLPSAVHDTARTSQETPVTIDVLANDTDPAGVGLRLVDAFAGAGGTPQVQGDVVVFTPATGFFGQASFTYKLADKTGELERTATGSVDVAVIGFPSAPPAPTGTIGSRTVTLTWAVPAANGAPIDRYAVQTPAGAPQNCSFVSATSCSITGLTNGTEYQFQVRAHNEAGDGPWSAPSEVLIPDIRPGPMEAPTARFGPQEITVSWSPPTNEGTPVSEYTLEISPGGGQQVLSGTTTSYVWTNLDNGTAYRFRVMAANDAGATDFSTYSNPEIPAEPPQPPDAPTTTRGDKQVTVTWVEPIANGDAIQRYELRVLKGGTVDHTDIVADPSVRNKVVAASNGASYTFALRAENKAGWSQWGPESAPIVPCGLAAAVTGVSATEGDTTSTLSFTPPSDNGCAISSYRYQPTGGGAQDLSANRVVTGLTNGQSYSFQVQACNSEGCGDFGPSSSQVVPFGVPGQPAVSGSVNGQTITWSWNTPSDNGRPITRFDIYLDGGLIEQSLATSRSQSFGYSETHTLEVAAVNERGASTRGGNGQRTVDPPRSVTIGKGAQHFVYPPNGDCTSSQCTYIDVSLHNFAPGQTVRVYCYSSLDTNGASFWNYPMATGNGNATTSVCVHGDRRYQVWVVVDGVRSNSISG